MFIWVDKGKYITAIIQKSFAMSLDTENDSPT